MSDAGKISIDELIRRALEFHGQGRLAQAEPLYRQALQAAPNHPDSLHLLGVLCSQMRRFDEAQALIGRAVAMYPNVAILHNSLGNVWADQGKPDQAVACYRQAIKLKPDYAEAHYNLGNAWYKQGRLAEGVASYRKALKLRPNYVEAQNNLGKALKDQRQFAQAADCYKRILQQRPDDAEAYYNLANVCLDLKQPAEAEAHYRQAIQRKPDYAEAHNNLGFLLAAQGQTDQAVECYRRALQLKPDYAEACFNLGTTLQEQGRLAEAIDAYRQAVQRKPDYAEAHNNLGNALREERRIPEAVECYNRALQLKPDYAEAHSNLGNALGDQGLHAQATACYRRALELKLDHAELYSNLGNALKEQGQFEEAAECYRQALRRKPDHLAALGQLTSQLQVMCQWEGLRELSIRAATAVEAGKPLKIAHTMPPFIFMAMTTPPATAGQQLCCASTWGREFAKFAKGARVADILSACVAGVPPASGVSSSSSSSVSSSSVSSSSVSSSSVSSSSVSCVPQQQPQQQQDTDKMSATHEGKMPSPRAGGTPATHSRITLGYFSADVREHPVARLIVELFEKHDRSRFSVLGYSYGPDDGSALRRRIVGAFDRFADVRDLSHGQIAQRIADDGVDILIDLTGYTQHARTQVLAMRPAPIQVNYLGYPGTMGAAFIDYILVDDFIAPSSRQPFFSEKLVQLPGSYQANDSRREIAPNTPTRAQCGLPENGFVFCAFHNSYKIGPEMFDAWIRLLKEVPGSVLWLLEDNRFAPANLRREAQARGVAAERLVFAPRMPLSEHLARHRLADVYLDAYPVNAHTTTSDALWVGCPVLTRSGDTFISRVAGSLLTTIGLPDLVTTNLADYERQALRLARDADYLADVRARILANRDRCGMFDAAHFAVGIEKAYATMWEIHAAGEAPRGFKVSPT